MTALPDFAPGTALTTSDFLAEGPTTSTPTASGNVVLGPFAMTSPAYLISLDASIPAAATTNIYGVNMQWQDPSSGVLLDEETWYLVASDNAIGSQSALVGGRGPCKSAQLQVTITNYDAVQTLTVKSSVYQSTRVVTRDDWRHLGLAALPNWTLPAVDPTNGILGYVAPRTLGAGVTLSRLCCLYAGQAQLIVGNSAGAALGVIVNSVNPVIGSADLVPLWANNVTAEQTVVDLTLARAPVQVSITNNGAATTLDWSLVQQEFSS